MYGDTKAAVLAKLKTVRTDVEPTTLTLSQFFEQYLEGLRATIRVTTWDRYNDLYRVHIEPLLGYVRLSTVAPVHVKQF